MLKQKKGKWNTISNNNLTNVIYAYKDKRKDKIVYVGQTVNLKNRHYDHMKQDPNNPKAREYNYPLSRGIRKYGEDNYELIILEENISQENLDEREIYWIEFYNTYRDGFNQNTGGTHYTTWYKYDEDYYQKIVMLLKDESKSFMEICELTGVSITHLYNINIGERRRNPNQTYPIRDFKFKHGQKLTYDEVTEIIRLLETNRYSDKRIGEMFGVKGGSISKINLGKGYRREGVEYPVRKRNYSYNIFVDDELLEDIILEINETTTKRKDIIKKYGINATIYNDINSGFLKGKEKLDYPLRKPFSSFSTKIINFILSDFAEGLTVKELTTKYNLTESTVRYLIKNK